LPALPLELAGLLQATQGRDQFVTPADERIAGSIDSATTPQDPPGYGLRDAEDLFDGRPVHPVVVQSPKHLAGVAKTMKIRGNGGHVSGYPIFTSL